MSAAPSREESLRAFEAACDAFDIKTEAERVRLAASRSVNSSLRVARAARSLTTPVPPAPADDLTGRFAALDPALAKV